MGQLIDRIENHSRHMQRNFDLLVRQIASGELQDGNYLFHEVSRSVDFQHILLRELQDHIKDLSEQERKSKHNA